MGESREFWEDYNKFMNKTLLCFLGLVTITSLSKGYVIPNASDFYSNTIKPAIERALDKAQDFLEYKLK